MKATCVDATPIPHFYGTIIDYRFPNGFIEEGETYEVIGIVNRGARGYILSGKPVIGVNGIELGWSPKRFKIVASEVNAEKLEYATT